MPEDPWQGSYDLMLDEARRAIAVQEADLAGLRARAGLLIGYAGVTATFFGALAAGTARPLASPLVWVVGLTFAAVVLMAGSVLSPRELEFVMSAAGIEAMTQTAHGPEHIVRSVAHAHEAAYLSNEPKLKCMHAAYAGGVVALGLEVLSLLVHLGGAI